MTDIATTPSMAEETTTSSAGDNRACSDRRSGKNECSSSKRVGLGTGVPPRQDPYTMEVDRGRNCYACRGFKHIAHHCRNRGRGRAMERRRVEYGRGRIEEINEHLNNLKGVENLELLN